MNLPRLPYFARKIVSLVALSSVLGMCSSTAEAGEPALKKGERIVFLGDSITQAGVKPEGYVTLVREALERNHPSLDIEVVGAGVSGNKVPDLQARLERDVLSKRPTLVVIYIGINDVWHSLQDRGTPADAFEAGLRSLIDKITQGSARVVLCTPSVIGEKPPGENPLDEMLEQYSQISRSVAKETDTQLLDLRAAFQKHLQQHNAKGAEKGVLTTDGVHLNAPGNQFVAAQMLKALGAEKATDARLRHVVLFQFKEDVTPQQVQEVVTAFAALPKKIEEIADFEYGTDVSVENKAAGFTHCFLVTFRNEEGRDAYLPHPAHQEFVKLVGPRLKNVLVFDYWAKD